MRPPHPPKPETRPMEAPRGPASRNFLLPPARLAVASRLAPCALPLRPPADWKRPRRRPGWERGRAAPRGPWAPLGCKLSGRREGGRRGAKSRQAPAPARPRGCSGHLPQRTGQRVVKFSLGGWGGGHKSQGPQAALALLGQPPAWAWFLLPWAPLEAFSTLSTLSPHPCSFWPGAASLENPISTGAPKVPTQSTRSPILGLLAVVMPPGPGSMDPARS